jgi:hypothetical protein
LLQLCSFLLTSPKIICTLCIPDVSAGSNAAGRLFFPFAPANRSARAREDHFSIPQILQEGSLFHFSPASTHTSRTRVTAILNRNTKDISTDLLLRVLYALGYTAKIKPQKAG